MNLSDNQKPKLILGLEDRTVNISDLIQARSNEILEFTNILKNKLAMLNKLPFQQLPRHLRRRAMSHNRYRIPSRIRNKVKNEDLQLKEPSFCRKHLRKPKLLLSSYARRSRKHKWLETHIWHAKRMKMIEYFCYKIPLKNYDKSARATYRFLNHSCIMYDMSYYSVIELKSNDKKHIIETLDNFLDKQNKLEEYLLKQSNPVLSGMKKGKITLFNTKKKIIQTVDYFWKPENVIFQQKTNENNKDNTTNMVIETNPENENPQIMWLIIHPGAINEFKKEFEGLVLQNKPQITYYEDCFSIFHLMGPATMYKIALLLKQLGYDTSNLEIESGNENSELVNSFEIIHDPGCYPKNFILNLSFEGLTKRKLVKPPRTITDLISQDNDKILKDQHTINNSMIKLASYQYKVPISSHSNIEKTIWHNPLEALNNVYNERFKIISRSRFTHKKSHIKIPEENKIVKKISKRKAKQLEKQAKREKDQENLSLLEKTKITGSDESSSKDLHQIQHEKLIPLKEPNDSIKKLFNLMILHDDGESLTNYGSGIKLLIPCGNGLLIWRILSYLNCKALGIEEYNHLLNESRISIFPNDYPYSSAYEFFSNNRKESLTKKYFDKPPAKRINYMTIGTRFPFYSNWDYVLDPNYNNKKLTTTEQIIPNADQSIPNGLKFVFLRMANRNYPVDMAEIYSPIQLDLKTYLEHKNRSDIDNNCIHSEPIHSSKWKGVLKQVKPEIYESELINIQTSRKLIGFVTSGYYSYRFGCGCGKGWISSNYIHDLEKEFQIPEKQKSIEDDYKTSFRITKGYYVLIKNPTSRNYHLAELYIPNHNHHCNI